MQSFWSLMSISMEKPNTMTVRRLGTSEEFMDPPKVKRLAFELQALTTTEPFQDVEINQDGNYVSNITATINGPVGTPYELGKFELRIVYNNSFPEVAPAINFLTPVFHPNIDEENGEICVDLFKEHWQHNTTVRKIIFIVKSLLAEPYRGGYLNMEAAKLFKRDYKKFVEVCTMKTEIFAGVTYEKRREAAEKYRRLALAKHQEKAQAQQLLSQKRKSGTPVTPSKSPKTVTTPKPVITPSKRYCPAQLDSTPSPSSSSNRSDLPESYSSLNVSFTRPSTSSAAFLSTYAPMPNSSTDPYDRSFDSPLRRPEENRPQRCNHRFLPPELCVYADCPTRF